MDADGYLSITGRLKEIINRGGEKISPREVDEVLMDHPAVQQVVTFAVPHDKLGEDVAAAVVLREGASATEKELREFAAHAARALQGAAHDPVPGRDPQGRDRQAAAHRPRPEARPGLGLVSSRTSRDREGRKGREEKREGDGDGCDEATRRSLASQVLRRLRACTAL